MLFLRKTIFLIIRWWLTCLALVFLFIPGFTLADSEGQAKTFSVNSPSDLKERTEVSSILQKISEWGYFYLENEWYQNLSPEQRETINQSLEALAQEFDNNIYPRLTQEYGPVWTPGIDQDARITILFHQMKDGQVGYYRDDDEYPKLQSQKSNEREMVYLNVKSLFSPFSRAFLGHEFTHLISFNQKERLRGVKEETWLNEARAEYAPTLLGYNDEFQNSNLQQRVKQFISSPQDSLTEWQNQESDYGAVNVFVHYLVDHYGFSVLSDSLRSSQIGLNSINEALLQKGIQKDFSQIFTDWTVAISLNDCSVKEEYCYQNKNLKNLRVSSSLIFLPSTQKTSVSLDYAVKPWSGNWYRIIGGEGDLKLVFEGDATVKFKIPYILCKENQNCQVDFLNLDSLKKGNISFQNFGSNYSSFTLIPSAQSKFSGFDGKEPTSSFSLFVSIENKATEERLIAELKAKIEILKLQIVQVQAKIAAIAEKGLVCSKFIKNLYYGLKGQEIWCLQKFLKSEEGIYPEAAITGFFDQATHRAVIRFQEKYAPEVLLPLGLKKGTGFVGSLTRAKINSILFP